SSGARLAVFGGDVHRVVLVLRRRNDGDLVDTVTVHVDDLDAVSIDLDVFAFGGNVAELVEDETADRLEAALFLTFERLDVEDVSHFVRAEHAIDQPGTVIALDCAFDDVLAFVRADFINHTTDDVV